VVEVDPTDLPDMANPAGELSRYRWMTIDQMVGLLRHTHYVNVQARSLITCLHSLVAGDDLRQTRTW